MKQLFLPLALLCSSTAFAFPNYNSVACTGNLNGHKLYLEYTRKSHTLILKIDEKYGKTYANESGNRIYTDAEHDDRGNSYTAELLSNSINWSAAFNLYTNNQLIAAIPMNCKKLGLTFNEKQKVTSAELFTSLATL